MKATDSISQLLRRASIIKATLMTVFKSILSVLHVIVQQKIQLNDNTRRKAKEHIKIVSKD
jgi:hypothetical protein